MRKISLIIGLLTLITSCKKNNEPIVIEKFVWIQHNQNWISNPDDLQARFYIAYNDSCNFINLAKTNISIQHSDFYKRKAPYSLRDSIISNLYQKKYPESFSNEKGHSWIYDGDFYCIIYKFKNENEKIINYKTYNIPDSLKNFFDYLESMVQLKSYEKTDSFDRTSLINKYREIIIKSSPAPPIRDSIKFTPPVIKPDLK